LYLKVLKKSIYGKEISKRCFLFIPKNSTVAPFFENLAKEYTRIFLCKCDCEASNDLCDALGIKSIPTFIKYVNGKKDTVVNGVYHLELLEMVNGL
jgi:thiol-disulfide isomerase/thioredoxin